MRVLLDGVVTHIYMQWLHPSMSAQYDVASWALVDDVLKTVAKERDEAAPKHTPETSKKAQICDIR